MNVNPYSPVLVGIVYITMRAKYFSKYNSNNFDPKKFIELARFLEREKLHPQKYMDFIFGMLDYKKPLKPDKLIDPILVQQFRQHIHE